jgi:hypothetical protein
VATIDDLTALIPPPPSPADAEGDWRQVEATLGLRLPADYKQLVRTYGFGSFDDILLWTPFTRYMDGTTNVVQQNLDLLAIFEDLREDSPEDFPYPLYPEPGGLLQWASTGNGDALCFITEGEPDRWPVAVWNIRGQGADRHEVGAVDLLHGYFTGQRTVQALGPAPALPWFDPHRLRMQLYVRLSDSDIPYSERLRILRAALAPSGDRGAWEGDRDQRQDHVKAVERDWLLMYETAYGHQIRVAFPPEDAAQVLALILDAARAMGCEVVDTSEWPGATLK